MSTRRNSPRPAGPDPIATAGRRARRRAKLPADAACVFCGWVTPDLLLRAGRNLLEQDHVDGDANNPDFVTPLCPNHHAVRSEGQRRLGIDLRHDDERSLLEVHAAALRSRAAFHRDLARAEEQQAGKLSALAAALDEQVPTWRELPEARA